MGEPIVNHPREAIRCFYDNGLDVLVIGDFVLRKRGR
jgi:carbamoyltransferase